MGGYSCLVHCTVQRYRNDSRLWNLQAVSIPSISIGVFDNNYLVIDLLGPGADTSSTSLVLPIGVFAICCANISINFWE